LRDAKILSTAVGIRPYRKGGGFDVRLELEMVKTAAGATGGVKHIRIVHNYGHGGEGVTFHWGCASEVVSLLDNARDGVLRPSSALRSNL